MNQDTKEALREVIRRVVACPIPIGWRSQEIMPGGGERRSFSKGSNGYDVLARVEYEPGDDPRDIDWAATAQTGGQLVLTTQYMEPRDLKVFVLTDVNPTMNFGTYRTTKRLLAAELTASVIRSAEETQDKVGFFAYSEHHVEASFRPRGAQRAMFSAITQTALARLYHLGLPQPERRGEGCSQESGTASRCRRCSYRGPARARAPCWYWYLHARGYSHW